ncbi:universal stress protein [Methyloraptor flagellatus]|jgi:nucleotide-binding universal stress UspA family protein|uniref:Universal stress protein n=1 Tax=Methyloraptor flagellatus TaxID=3162530 RepID=A0AAU7XC55_9HYPH
MFKKVVVPVDPGEIEFARKAVENAVAMVVPGGEIRLVSVMVPMGGYVSEFLPADFEANLEKETDDRMKEIAKAIAHDGKAISTSLRMGSIYHEVLDEAQEFGADLIVISSHRPAMSTYLLGSNAAKIVRHALCSVLVLRD